MNNSVSNFYDKYESESDSETDFEYWDTKYSERTTTDTESIVNYVPIMNTNYNDQEYSDDGEEEEYMTALDDDDEHYTPTDNTEEYFSQSNAFDKYPNHEQYYSNPSDNTVMIEQKTQYQTHTQSQNIPPGLFVNQPQHLPNYDLPLPLPNTSTCSEKSVPTTFFHLCSTNVGLFFDSFVKWIIWFLFIFYTFIRNLVLGIVDIGIAILFGLQKISSFRIVPPQKMFAKGKWVTTATGGPMLYSLFVESWILVGFIYMIIAIGTTGELAETVKIDYLSVSLPALFSIPLGLYIFAWGGFKAKTSTAQNVITVYMVLEIMKLVGDLLNLFRFSYLIHTRQHWGVLLTNKIPEWVEKRVSPEELKIIESEFKHGECAEPHSILLLILISYAIMMILSFMNISTLLWKCVSKNDDFHKMSTSDIEADDDEDDSQSESRFKVQKQSNLIHPKTRNQAQSQGPGQAQAHDVFRKKEGSPNYVHVQHPGSRPSPHAQVPLYMSQMSNDEKRSRLVKMILNDNQN